MIDTLGTSRDTAVQVSQAKDIQIQVHLKALEIQTVLHQAAKGSYEQAVAEISKKDDQI
jgi:hypothetical protein